MQESNEYVSPFVGDGYDTEVTIPASPGQWSAVKLRYRPLSAVEESVIFAKKNLQPDEPITRFYAEAFAPKPPAKAKILGWDLKRKNEAGELVPLPITAASIEGLSPPFFALLKGVIDGSFVLNGNSLEADTKNS